jgi:hypothetical protein
MNEGEHEQTVGARPYADAFVRDGTVAGSAGIDRNHLDAARLEPAETDLDEEPRAELSLPVRGKHRRRVPNATV